MNGDIYALTTERDALLVLDGTDHRVLQVIENNFDGVHSATELGDISVSPTGLFVRMRDSGLGVITLSRDPATGELSFLSHQIIDEGGPLFAFGGSEPTGIKKLVFAERAFLAAALIEFVGDNGEIGHRVKAYSFDFSTGELTPIPDVDPLFIGHDGEINHGVNEQILDIAVGDTTIYVLQRNGLGEEYFAGYVPLSGVGFNIEQIPRITTSTDMDFSGADGLVASDNLVHVLGEEDNFVTTFETGFDSAIYLQRVQNGTRGVTGLIGPTSVTESVDGSFAFITTRDSDSLVVVQLDGSGAMAQRLTNNSGGAYRNGSADFDCRCHERWYECGSLARRQHELR